MVSILEFRHAPVVEERKKKHAWALMSFFPLGFFRPIEPEHFLKK